MELRSYVSATALLLVALLVPGTATAQDDNPLTKIQEQQREIYQDVAPSVVFITVDDAVGSGFFVSSDGVVLTNQHVVQDRETVKMVLLDGTKTTGEVIERADKLDVALVRADVDDAESVPTVGMGDVEVGDWVASIGHGEGGIWTFTTGMVTNIYPGGDRPTVQTQIPINRGNSGGPIIDKEGRAIGIVTLKHKTAEAMNLAIPIEEAFKHLDKLDDTCDCLVVETQKKAPVYIDGTMVGRGPRVVIPAEEKTYEIVVVVDGKPVKREVTWPDTREVQVD